MRKLLAYYLIWFTGIAIWGFITYWLMILVHFCGVPYGGAVGFVTALVEIAIALPFIFWLADN